MLAHTQHLEVQGGMFSSEHWDLDKTNFRQGYSGLRGRMERSLEHSRILYIARSAVRCERATEELQKNTRRVFWNAGSPRWEQRGLECPSPCLIAAPVWSTLSSPSSQHWSREEVSSASAKSIWKTRTLHLLQNAILWPFFQMLGVLLKCRFCFLSYYRITV